MARKFNEAPRWHRSVCVSGRGDPHTQDVVAEKRAEDALERQNQDVQQVRPVEGASGFMQNNSIMK